MASGGAESVGKTELLLGVDGGGVTTQAVIATLAGEILGRGLGPPSNHHRVGDEAACQALKTAIGGAFAQVAGVRPIIERSSSWAQTGGIVAACFGLPGVDGASDEAIFARWLESQGVTFKFTICNDSELILGGGTPEGWGVALISGTGSICLGRTPGGQTSRVGGWGQVLGDEGSGYRIASEGLQQATQAADGRGGSQALLHAALAHYHLRDARGLIGVVSGPSAAAEDVTAFATRVLEAAHKGDAPAREIAERAATALALHVDTVIRKLALKQPPLAMGGAMMRVSLKKMVLDHLQSALGPVALVADPVQGAVATARRLYATGAGDQPQA